MKNRGFQFNAICVCGACVMTGVLASMLTGWALFGQMRTAETAPALEMREIPVARASGCDRAETYVTCAGVVDMGVEAVFVLDSLTGQLFAGVLSKNVGVNAFQAKYQGNVKSDFAAVVTKYNNDLAKIASRTTKSRTGNAATSIAANQQAIQVPQEPKFIMTTGMHDQTGRGSNIMPSVSALYVTEVNTGLMLVYMLPWSKTAHASNKPYVDAAKLMFYERVVTPMVAEQEL